MLRKDIAIFVARGRDWILTQVWQGNSICNNNGLMEKTIVLLSKVAKV